MSQKVENLLNLALDATEEERAKSLELDVGYNPIEWEWELIIKYSGSLEEVRAIAFSVTEMANEYAVISIAESRIEELTRIPVVDFIEKPKRLFFQVMNGKRVSCINEVQRSPFVFVRNSGNVANERIGRKTGEDVQLDNLYGSEVLIGIVDSGIDFNLLGTCTILSYFFGWGNVKRKMRLLIG